MFRLGKYNKDSSRPRPILVKLLRSCDVQCILSKRSSPEAPISVKPDMTIEEHNNEKIILKQCWLLLRQKINRKQIRIRGNILFLNNKLYGRVSQGQFHLSDNPNAPDIANSTMSSVPSLLPTQNRCSDSNVSVSNSD